MSNNNDNSGCGCGILLFASVSVTCVMGPMAIPALGLVFLVIIIHDLFSGGGSAPAAPPKVHPRDELLSNGERRYMRLSDLNIPKDDPR